MSDVPKLFFASMIALALVAMDRVLADEPLFLTLQSAGEDAQTAPGGGVVDAQQPNPELCTGCYQQLQKDNRDCEPLKGQDWQVCREAASVAYRQCSQGC